MQFKKLERACFGMKLNLKKNTEGALEFYEAMLELHHTSLLIACDCFFFYVRTMQRARTKVLSMDGRRWKMIETYMSAAPPMMKLFRFGLESFTTLRVIIIVNEASCIATIVSQSDSPNSNKFCVSLSTYNNIVNSDYEWNLDQMLSSWIDQ